MRTRVRPLLLLAAFALGLAAAGGVAGYVYAHEPARDILVVEFTGTPVPTPEHVTGTVLGIEGGALRLALAEGGERSIPLPDGVPVEELERLAEALPEGARVNVGVEDGAFGQVLTGVVAIEGAP